MTEEQEFLGDFYMWLDQRANWLRSKRSLFGGRLNQARLDYLEIGLAYYDSWRYEPAHA